MTLKSLYKSASSMPPLRSRQTQATLDKLMRYRSSVSDQQRNTTRCVALMS